MSKKPFVQAAAIAFLPVLKWDLDKAIHWADRLWEALSERGYGAPQKRGPREVEQDWLAKLAPEQRKGFDRFWSAFSHKAGKQRAAMRWGQLAPDAALTDRICDAAKQEAQRQRKEGEVRKMAEGWLTERRWEDFAPSKQAGAPAASVQAANLRAEIASLEQLGLRDQAERKRAQLAELECAQ